MHDNCFATERHTVHQSGFAPGSDERIAQQARGGDGVARRLAREAMRGPRDRQPELDEALPQEFIGESMAKLRIHVAAGNFEQAKVTIDEIESAWQLRQHELSSVSALPLQHRMAVHVNRLGLSPRTVNMIEDVCNGTLGALLEAFPRRFASVPGCGSATARTIAEALMRAGVIDGCEAQRRIDEFAILWPTGRG